MTHPDPKLTLLPFNLLCIACVVWYPTCITLNYCFMNKRQYQTKHNSHYPYLHPISNQFMASTFVVQGTTSYFLVKITIWSLYYTVDFDILASPAFVASVLPIPLSEVFVFKKRPPVPLGRRIA